LVMRHRIYNYINVCQYSSPSSSDWNPELFISELLEKSRNAKQQVFHLQILLTALARRWFPVRPPYESERLQFH
jgi:hypothetical protein